MESGHSSTCTGEERGFQTNSLALYQSRSIQAWQNNGDEINAVDTQGNFALFTPLMRECGIDSIRCLLLEGVDMNAANCADRSTLCIALQHPNCNPDLVVFLLNEGATMNTCKMHKTLLECYFTVVKKIKPSVLKVLFISQIGRRMFDRESLCLALRMVTCRADVVKALLDMGCLVNSCILHESSFGCYFDERALNESKDLDEEVVKLLLDSVTKVGKVYESKRSPLCLALAHSKCTVAILKLFLEARPSFRKCSFHRSDLHCLMVETAYKAYDAPMSRFRKTEILKLFLTRAADLQEVGSDDISAVHFALHHFHFSADVLRLFLDAGANMDGCSIHGSILMCYVTTNTVRADVVKLLLEQGVDAHEVSINGDTALHSALRYSNYEVAAIEMLMDHPGFDINKRGRKKSSFLHCALQNSYYKQKVVKLLLNKGARADAVDSKGYTTLDIAVSNPCCDLDIFQMLLNNGCTVVLNNRMEVTPLEIVLKSNRRVDVLRLLLTAGAPNPVDVKCNTNGLSLLELASAYYDILEKRDDLDCLEMFVKYALLLTPHLDIDNLIEGRIISRFKRDAFLDYVSRCLNEIKCMDAQYVVPGVTLRQLAGGLKKDIVYNLDVLLKILATNEFPIYFDIISARVKREVMETKLLKLQAYLISDLPCKGKVVLDSDSSFHIGHFLSNNDLLSYLVVYNVT